MFSIRNSTRSYIRTRDQRGEIPMKKLAIVLAVILIIIALFYFGLFLTA